MLLVSRVYVDQDNLNPDRFLATEGHVLEMDPSEVGVFGFGRRCVNIRGETSMKLTENFSPFSKCPGQSLAELSTWLGVASILAAFDVSAALDDNGNPSDVRYALSRSTHLVT